MQAFFYFLFIRNVIYSIPWLIKYSFFKKVLFFSNR